jgi:alpha-tubulin suppressor-like RCC1 family protein
VLLLIAAFAGCFSVHTDLYACGNNDEGELGLGQTNAALIPNIVPVTWTGDFVQLSAAQLFHGDIKWKNLVFWSRTIWKWSI